MLVRGSGSSLLVAILAVAVAVSSAPAVASDDGAIILRLEDDQPARSESAAPETPGPTPQVIDVPPSAAQIAPQPRIKAASAVLMDARTGQVLYARNPHVRRPNASTTKIMTAILLIEHCRMTDKIKASKKASETPYTSIHLKPGEQILARDLLMGMMVRSANDAAVAAAEHIAGSTSKFAAMMNRRAREIGCRNTHFLTPNGLYSKDHYSTAYDLCLMARYGFQYDLFNEAISTRKHFLDSRTVNKKDLAVFSRCKFLRDYPWADGAKSGYVKQAGYCLVGSATQGGWRLVCAVLKSDNAGRDVVAAMDYGFAGFEPYTVARANLPCAGAEIRGGDRATVPAAPVEDVRVVVPKTGARITTRLDLLPLEAPVVRGAKLGKIVASVNGKPAAAVELLAAEDVGISVARRAWWWAKTCGLVVAVLLVGRRYGTTAAKGPRRRGRGVTATLRGIDRFR